MDDDNDLEASLEERCKLILFKTIAFRMWMNSLGIDNFYINNMYEDLKDGINLLKILDNMQ